MHNTQKITPKQTLKQTYKINHTYINSLKILKMSQEQLLSHLKKVMNDNPFIEFNTNYIDSETNLSALDFIHSEATLQDELFYQLHTCKEHYSRKVCDFIIESLNDNGFLSYSYEEYCTILKISKDEFFRNLRIIQNFEPTGVAAENAIDCLKLQLLKDSHEFAVEVLTNCQKELLSGDLHSIASKYKIPFDKVVDALSIIKNLNPYPCSGFTKKETPYVYPDIKIEIVNNELIVSPIEYGRLEYNKDYFAAVQKNSVLNKYFEEAVILISDIQKRNSTLLLIVNEVVKFQSDYFLFNAPLKQCKLEDISRRLGIHNSTISRCVKNKYFQFYKKVLPLRSLFIAKKTQDITDPIQKAIRKLILTEDPTHPYSDFELYILLKKQNITIARRTIAKYRSIMNINNSSKRRNEYHLDGFNK